MKVIKYNCHGDNYQSPGHSIHHYFNYDNQWSKFSTIISKIRLVSTLLTQFYKIIYSLERKKMAVITRHCYISLVSNLMTQFFVDNLFIMDRKKISEDKEIIRI